MNNCPNLQTCFSKLMELCQHSHLVGTFGHSSMLPQAR